MGSFLSTNAIVLHFVRLLTPVIHHYPNTIPLPSRLIKSIALQVSIGSCLMPVHTCPDKLVVLNFEVTDESCP